MQTIELVAASLSEAQEQAAAKLGVSVDDLTIEVLDETKGLFGKPGKVTVRATASAPPAPVEEADPASAEVEEKPKKKPARGKKSAEEPVSAEDDAPAVVEETVAEAPASPARGKKSAKVEKKEEGDGEDEPEGPAPTASEEDADTLVALLNGLISAGDLRAEAKWTSLNNRYVHVEIDGKDVGYLVGRRGEVLNALQYLLNVISARQLDNGVRVVLEGDSYRQRREQTLTTMAQNIAREVKARGEEAVLDALPAFERRIIHQAIVDMEGVTTYSEGEEPNRRVVIAPADA